MAGNTVNSPRSIEGSTVENYESTLRFISTHSSRQSNSLANRRGEEEINNYILHSQLLINKLSMSATGKKPRERYPPTKTRPKSE